LHPGTLAFIILIIAVFRSQMSQIETVSWLITITILDGIIPFAFYMYFTRKGFVFDDRFDNPKVLKQRISIFIILLVTTVTQFIILASTKQYQPLISVFAGGIIAVSIVTLITSNWKISLHSGMVTLFASMIIYIYGFEKTWPMLLLIPLIFWSRLKLKRHTIWQLLGGMALAIMIVFFTLAIFQKLY